MRDIARLPRLLLEPVVRAALAEDLGRAGDITSDAVIPATMHARLALNARETGVLAGIDLACLAFQLIDPTIQIDQHLQDGEALAPGSVIATLNGPARSLLAGERVALNFISHLSGIASATSAIVEAIKDTGTRVACTRKTMPGMRMLQKYAVRVGGGLNHRFGLDDAILIKDNHIAIAGGITEAVTRAREAVGHLVKIEVEVDTIEQLREVLRLPVDAVLLDNMRGETLREAVRLVDKRLITEASGRITAATAREVANCGVDLISIGWLTHSPAILDIGLDAV